MYRKSSDPDGPAAICKPASAPNSKLKSKLPAPQNCPAIRIDDQRKRPGACTSHVQDIRRRFKSCFSPAGGNHGTDSATSGDHTAVTARFTPAATAIEIGIWIDRTIYRITGVRLTDWRVIHVGSTRVANDPRGISLGKRRRHLISRLHGRTVIGLAVHHWLSTTIGRLHLESHLSSGRGGDETNDQKYE